MFTSASDRESSECRDDEMFLVRSGDFTMLDCVSCTTTTVRLQQTTGKKLGDYSFSQLYFIYLLSQSV